MQTQPSSAKDLLLLEITIIFVLLLTATMIALAERADVATKIVATTENTILVKAGADLQAALNRAQPGSTIKLEAGATFTGTFRLPSKRGDNYITIRTSAEDDRLPGKDVRIDPVKYASMLPKLISPLPEPVMTAESGAHHYRFIGIEFGGTRDGVGNIIKLGTGEEKRIEDLPHHIEFDRVYIHSTSPEGQRRGIAANGKFIRIINSHISDIKRRGEESQAIAVWSTDGPVEIINNYLEAAAENILFGGASSVLALTPTDCVVSNNHLNKPPTWKTEGWVVKNLFEIKHGRRIKVTNNLLTNNWGMGQDGTAVLFSTRDDSGENVVIEDVEFRNNIIRNSTNGLSVYGGEGKGGHRLSIINNIFEGIGEKNADGSGRFMKSTAWNGLTIENNTIINSGNITSAYGVPVKNFIFRNNIVFGNEYGFKGDSTASGRQTIDKYFPGSDVSSNIIIGVDSNNYPAKNFIVGSVASVGFVNYIAGDYTLRPDSKLLNRSSEGKSIGASLNASTVGKWLF